MHQISFMLKPLPPFSLKLTAWALRRRPDNEIDRWDGSVYSRIVVFEGKAAKISVFQEGGINKPKLYVMATGEASVLPTLKSRITSMLEWMFSIRKDLKEFYLRSARDKRLKPLVERFVGLKPPRFPTVFESLINAIVCQQISLDAGIIILSRLSRFHGMTFKENDASYHAFPRPEDLAGLSTEDLKKQGLSRNKEKAIIELSQGIVGKAIEIEHLEKRSDAEIVRYLTGIWGIGRWSAEYALLRGIGRIHMFPGDDVGAQRNLQSLLRLAKKPDYERIKSITARWQPYAGFIYFHILLEKLRAKGHLI